MTVATRSRVCLSVHRGLSRRAPDLYPPRPTADVPFELVPGRHRLDPEGWPERWPVRVLATDLPPRRRVAVWLVFAIFAVLVPLALAVTAVTVESQTAPAAPSETPRVEVSTDSPKPWLVPVEVSR